MSPRVINMLMNPGPYWPLSLWGFRLPVGGGQRTALCQGGVLAARRLPASLGTVRTGETKDKNFSPTFLTRLWRRGSSRRRRGRVDTFVLEHTRCRCFSQDLFDRAARRETSDRGPRAWGSGVCARVVLNSSSSKQRNACGKLGVSVMRGCSAVSFRAKQLWSNN